MTLQRSTHTLGSLVVAAVLGVMCRSYEVIHPDGADTGGSQTGGIGHGGDSGASGANDTGGVGGASGADGRGGDGGESGNSGGESGTGGSAGADSGTGGSHSGGTAGISGDGAGGQSGDGTAGESGGGSGPTTPPEPGILGAVRIFVGGESRCGGALITNDWVLTADQCVRSTDNPQSVVVGFGMSALNFRQTEPVIEIRRFGENDGSAEKRGRDVLLLGVARPFEIEGRTSGYYRPVWHMGPEFLLTPQVCVGWDLRVSTTSPTDTLHQEVVSPFAIEEGAMNDDTRPAGNLLWWLNTSADPEQGVLPMPADLGSACFHNYFDVTALSSIHSGNPELTRDNQDNNGRQAYAVALGEGVVHGWLRTELFDSTNATPYPPGPIRLTGAVGGCASSRDRLEVFGRVSDNAMTWWAFDAVAERWIPREPSLPLLVDATFSEYRPGAYCTSNGDIELFATDTVGRVWWLRGNSSGQWLSQWQRVSDARTPVESGIAVAGVVPEHFYLFARDPATQGLRVAEYDGRWTGKWDDRGGLLHGTPSVRMSQEGAINVFSLNIWDEPWQIWMYRGSWAGAWIYNQPVATSEPAVVSWGYNHFDVLTRSQAGTLRHVFWQGHPTGAGWSEIIDTDVELPLGVPMAISRQPGTTDLLITQSDGVVWHGFYPRKPRPNVFATPRIPEASASTP